MSIEASVHAKAVQLTRLSLEMTAEAGSGHATSAASLAHLVTVLMYRHMRYDPAKPADPAADRLVISEGHACPIVYAAAADLGIVVEGNGGRHALSPGELKNLRKIDSELDGHPNPAEGFPFFPAATGSLGQGLSMAAGLALAARLDGLDRRVYCLIGDGESREGQISEALDFLVEHELYAVCPIFNCNELGQAARVSAQQSSQRIGDKLRAFGFEVDEIDGHEPTDIITALEQHRTTCERGGPQLRAIVARTVKGWGSPSLHGEGHHGKPPEGEDLDLALAELEETAKRLGVAGITGDDLGPPPKPPKAKIPAANGRLEAADLPSFEEALRQFDQAEVLEKKELATRKAYGLALRALGHHDPDVMSLDGDVSNSTYSKQFASDPDLRTRFVECRIAEQNMVSAAVGLASAGKKPFVSTFGKFMTRAYDQVEMGVITRVPLRLVGSHVGVSLAADGPSQMALPDVAFFRSIGTAQQEGVGPVFYTLTPSDAYGAYALTLAMARYEGGTYLRTLRPTVPFLYGDDVPFTLGGHQVLAEGKDLLIVASGYMVHEALKARRALEEAGIKATLMDLYSLPFEPEGVLERARACGGRVLTVEDNYGGSMGSAVADVLMERGAGGSLRQMYVRRIPKSGRQPDEVLAYLGLSKEDIVENVRRLLGK